MVWKCCECLLKLQAVWFAHLLCSTTLLLRTQPDVANLLADESHILAHESYVLANEPDVQPYVAYVQPNKPHVLANESNLLANEPDVQVGGQLMCVCAHCLCASRAMIWALVSVCASTVHELGRLVLCCRCVFTTSELTDCSLFSLLSHHSQRAAHTQPYVANLLANESYVQPNQPDVQPYESNLLAYVAYVLANEPDIQVGGTRERLLVRQTRCVCLHTAHRTPDPGPSIPCRLNGSHVLM